MSTPRLVLVLGGTRSGKSAVAERLAAAAGGPVRYLATAPTGPTGDPERIASHRARRPSTWTTVELGGSVDLAGAVRDAGGDTVLLDGLGAWLGGALHDAGLLDDGGRGADPAHALDGAAAIATIEQAVEGLVAAALARTAGTIVVGEEAGMAPVAGDRGTRRWVDLLGTAHQALAARADRVLLVVAGRAIELPAGDAPTAIAPSATTPAPSAPVVVPATSGAPERIAAEVPTDDPTPADPGTASDAPPGASASRSPAPDDRTGPAAAPRDAGPDRPRGDGDATDPGAPPLESPVGDGTHEPDGAAEPSDAPDPPAASAAPLGADTGLLALRLHGDRMVPEGTIDFAVNVVAGDPPGWATQALQAGLSRVGRYPDEREATAAVAARHARPTDGVLPLGGAAEGFWRLALAVRPRRAAVLVPGFTEAEAALRSVGAEIVRVRRDPARDWALDPEAIPEDCDLVALGRPENPTGTLDPREAILRLRRPGRTILVDEAFADFLPPDADALADHRPDDDGPGDLVVLRSLTKALAVPGVRAGYVLAEPELVERLRLAGPPWTCPTPALELLRAYAERPDACERIAARTAAHRDDLLARLRQIAGVQVWESQANFLLARVPAGIDAVTGLHARGIAVRPCTTFAGLDDRFVRIAVRTPALHARLVQALAAVISEAEQA
jgi:histidinol-phosphate/aromatic aminotransferase/cobyric acid decarboxylase-like protein/adenosyl cobinamide kinase/adenosyl cobinamide phosphate guanylyltransferase